jgi:hypothetical protein
MGRWADGQMGRWADWQISGSAPRLVDCSPARPNHESVFLHTDPREPRLHTHSDTLPQHDSGAPLASCGDSTWCLVLIVLLTPLDCPVWGNRATIIYLAVPPDPDPARPKESRGRIPAPGSSPCSRHDKLSTTTNPSMYCVLLRVFARQISPC